MTADTDHKNVKTEDSGDTVDGSTKNSMSDDDGQDQPQDDNDFESGPPPVTNKAETGDSNSQNEQRKDRSSSSNSSSRIIQQLGQNCYISRKPKWWRHLAGRATKAQKRAVRSVLDDHGLRLMSEVVPYGSQLDWDVVFPSSASSEHDDDNNNNSNNNNAQQQQATNKNSSSSNRKRRIWLELGFGRGENLLALAHRYRRDLGFCVVGAEIHNPGIGMVCQRIQQAWESSSSSSEKNDNDNEGKNVVENKTEMNAELPVARYWTDYTTYSTSLDPYANDPPDTPECAATLEHPHIDNNNNNQQAEEEESITKSSYSNLRIHPGDGFKLLPKIPSGSLDAILVTFPDPFPKEAQTQWRLIQVQTVLEFHRILRKAEGNRPGGVFFLATDHKGYFEWTHSVMDQVNNIMVERDDDNDDDDDDDDAKSTTKFRLVEPCPSRMQWLPAISTYEQKGWDEGRSTNLACWEAAWT
ncbi:MAG: hypothetical protein SGILL_006741 [Bacillariaceae sp.]